MKGREPYRWVYHAIDPTEKSVTETRDARDVSRDSKVPVDVELVEANRTDAERVALDVERDAPRTNWLPSAPKGSLNILLEQRAFRDFSKQQAEKSTE